MKDESNNIPASLSGLFNSDMMGRVASCLPVESLTALAQVPAGMFPLVRSINSVY